MEEFPAQHMKNFRRVKDKATARAVRMQTHVCRCEHCLASTRATAVRESGKSYEWAVEAWNTRTESPACQPRS